MNGISVATNSAAAIHNAVREPRAVPGAKLYDAPARVGDACVATGLAREGAFAAIAVPREHGFAAIAVPREPGSAPFAVAREGAPPSLAPGIAGGIDPQPDRGREGGRYNAFCEPQRETHVE